MPPEGRRTLGGTGGAPALVVLADLALGLVAHWPVLPGEPSRIFYRCDCGDVAQTVWFLAWTPAHS